MKASILTGPTWVSLIAALSCARAIEPAQAFNPTAAWDFYAKALTTKPLLTKSLTSCATNAFSDVLCQKLVQQGGPDDAEDDDEEGGGASRRIDATRLAHASAAGLVWSGPITHAWYALLFGTLTASIKGPVAGLAAQIALDALIFSPVTVSGYFTVRSILEGSGLAGAREKLRSKLVPTVLGAWKFWPAANVINFGLVPVAFRVLYMNVLSVFWSGYLTYVNSRKTSTG